MFLADENENNDNESGGIFFFSFPMDETLRCTSVTRSSQQAAKVGGQAEQHQLQMLASLSRGA